MADESKSNDKKPEKPSEEIKEKPVEELQADTKETVEEKTEETSEEPETKEPTEEKSSEETPKGTEDTPKVETAEPKKGEEKPVKTEEKKEKTKKQDDEHGKDFKYIVRISNTDVDGEKKVVFGLTSIKGISVQMATIIADDAGIKRYAKVGDLKDADIEKLQSTVNKIIDIVPSWMLNHRKDYETGEDIHLIGAEIDMRLRDEINIMKKIRSYRGIRHERGLPCRGQRTRANNRRGLALGVSKKREP